MISTSSRSNSVVISLNIFQNDLTAFKRWQNKYSFRKEMKWNQAIKVWKGGGGGLK